MNFEETKPSSEWYPQFRDKVDLHILHLRDGRGMFLVDKVDKRNLRYFVSNCIDKPWNNHLLLTMLVQTDRNLDPGTVYHRVRAIHPRMEDLFSTYSLHNMSEFDVEVHVYEYLRGAVHPEHSNNTRTTSLKAFQAVAYTTKKWLVQKFCEEQQTYFEQFLFSIPSFDSRDFAFRRLAIEQAQNTRKDETDAILPYLPDIRSAARLRWSQVKRLREAFQQAIREAQKRPNHLPVEFNYDEPERIRERFHFRLWDKPSFTLHHQHQFSDSVIRSARARKGAYLDEKNHYFVEFIKAERLHDDEAPYGLWFTELVSAGVLGQWSQTASEEEVQRKRALLKSWGYGAADSRVNSLPFYTQHKGILFQSPFVARHKDQTEGILFDVEPFYAACTFGLLAIDVFTTTGARMNELLQLNNTKECIQVKKVKDRLHFSFRAIPKGRDEVEEFYISKQTMENVQIVARMLKDHYKSDKIPSVEYRHYRSHLFPEAKPYYFQYHNKAMDDIAISSCIRFVLHGLTFETQEGNPVTMKSHLLRHAFATEAVQRHKMPIDIVAKILHQRDLNVTKYYSAPTPTQIAQAVDELHDVVSSFIDMDEALLRSPEELHREFEEHSKKVGVFNKVLGGTCVTDFVCPIKMACLGCKAKIPEPEQEDELREVIELSRDMETRFEKMGLHVEVRKAKKMRTDARTELREIELIKQYREERQYEPTIKLTN